jgi:hypothetical protein
MTPNEELKKTFKKLEELCEQLNTTECLKIKLIIFYGINNEIHEQFSKEFDIEKEIYNIISNGFYILHNDEKYCTYIPGNQVTKILVKNNFQ